MEKIGIVGAGNMGYVMIEEFLEKEYKIWVFDIEEKAKKRAEKIGARPTNSLKELCQNCSKIFIVLPGPEAVKEIVRSESGLLKHLNENSVIVDFSTVDPETTEKNAKIAEAKNIYYFDAPILGRPNMCGKWTLPVGGKKENLDVVKKDLEILAERIIYIGKNGKGNTIKILNNLMFGAINSITAEIFALAKKLDISHEKLFNSISKSDAASVSNLFLEIGPKIVDRDFEPTVTVDVIHENLKLGIELAQKNGFPMLVSESNQKVNEIAKIKGWGNEDSSSIVKVYESLINEE